MKIHVESFLSKSTHLLPIDFLHLYIIIIITINFIINYNSSSSSYYYHYTNIAL